MTVVALPDDGPRDIPVLDEADLDEQFIRASGPGGQNVNKVSSVCRLTHRPTGLTVVASEERSQWQNRQLARARLSEMLAGYACASAASEQNSARQAVFDEHRSFTWTGWRDEVKGPCGKASMSRALSGRLGPLLR